MLAEICRIMKFFSLILLTETTLESKAIKRSVSTLGCFPFFHKLFLELIFKSKIQTMLLKQSAVLLPVVKKYCAYYVSEHLKYCTKINVYLLNTNVCLNIALNKTVFNGLLQMYLTTKVGQF